MGMAMNSPVWRMPHVLYRLFSDGGVLLYVGITSDFETRMKAHARERDWWSEVASHRLERYLNRRVALYAEARVIEREQPIHNVAFGPKKPRSFAVEGRPPWLKLTGSKCSGTRATG